MDLSHRPARIPSPTLTDPDMILPTPNANQDSFPQQPTHESHHSPTADDGQMKSPMRSLLGGGPRLRHKGSEKGLKTQENPEVRPQSKQSELSQRSAGSTLASSPLLHDDFGFKTMPDNRVGEGANDHWDSVDDASLISESVSPLVEAEREGYLMSENGGLGGYKFSDRFRKAIVEEDDESYSHAAMSVRAEEILANAKKRLTEMESNLNQARHTVNRPSSSMSSFNTGSHGQSLYTLPKKLPPSKHRQQNPPPSISGSKGHSRVFSETSVPSSMQTVPPHREVRTDDVRSPSAMGSDPKQASDSRDWFWAGLTRDTNYGNRQNNFGLQPLNEDGPAPATFDSSERQPSPPTTEDIAQPTPSQETPDSTLHHSGSSSNGLTRARSTNQMRDIRDQMQDLKGKISSLKQRAREDSLRRRSLQSLRTPSPFTAAEQWYHGAPGLERDRSRSRPREASSPKIQPVVEEETETKQYPVQEPGEDASKEVEVSMDGPTPKWRGSDEDNTLPNGPVAHENDGSPKAFVDGSITEEEDGTMEQSQLEGPSVMRQENGPDEENGDMEEEILDAPALPVGGRHEDRPDAFDYEHLFLHSRMGTLGQGAKSRSSSHSSAYSIETTKPSNVSATGGDVGSDSNASLNDSLDEESLSDPQNSIHERKGSVASVSTAATFATATEGEGAASDTDEEEWVYKRPMAGAWQPEHAGGPKVTASKRRDVQSSAKATKATTQARGRASPERTEADAARSPISPRSEMQSADAGVPDDLLGLLTSCLLSGEDGGGARPIELNDSDRELAAKLVRSVAKVCAQLQAYSIDGNKYGGRPWRRRLDGARRVLDGETNGEVF
ncbi:MAG: hypothetical protein Q9228_003962 [Teloschistes exilis]